jgi:3-oxoacyl-[acyl-carrier-protein] synthase-3
MSYKKFSKVKLVGIAGAVPDVIKTNQALNGETSEIQKTAKIVGIKSRQVASDNICTSDLCYSAADKLLNTLKWERDSIDALIFLSQTPDYLLPATSCVLQARLNLSNSCAAFDMSLGCSGYIYGLLVAYSLISANGIRRVLLLVGDTISKVISPHDVPANILFGDAGTATAIEYDENTNDSFITVSTDGSGANSIIIEAGGFRKPKSLQTNTRKPHLKDNVLRSEEELFIDGSAVFSFTLSRVPKSILDLLLLM